jgi:predicted DCC family thiol-disulfide oxidoreductase YuxK
MEKASITRGVVPDQLLLYDGLCGFCAASVQFVLRHERRRSLRFAPLQGQVGAQIRARHPELEGVDSMIWVEGPGTDGETIAVRSEAVLRTARYLGPPWSLVLLGRLLPAGVRDALYDFIARHRHKLVGGAEQCFLPGADVRARFLE